MNFGYPRFFNRIGGHMAVLVLVSLIGIHALITAGFFLIRHFESARPVDEGPGEIVASMRLAAATPRGPEREAMIARIANVFPRLHIEQTAGLPPGATPEPPRGFIQDHLGAGFAVAMIKGTPERRIAVQLPDGDILTAQVPPPPGPPLALGSPITFTLLLVIVSMTLLLVWAARALAAPLSGFAKAAESFSLDRDGAALPERGPEEMRAVARAFNRMRERIRKLVDDRTRMLAAMGHDLRTPITRLRLRTEFIADTELRGQILRDLDQMKSMTDGVLSFLRDGHASEAATTVDLASVLQTVCDQYADMGYAVAYDGPQHFTLTARPDDLQRAIANLVDNAVRHAAHVTVRLSANQTYVTISVDDDGPGIPDDRKAAMLEAFVRGEEARTMDDRAGFGLGLSIARAIAEAHDGALTLHNREPHGLSARITLPTR